MIDNRRKTMIDKNVCVRLDHKVETFTIEIRSLTGVHPASLKDLIERKYEVVRIEKTNDQSHVINP